jgi:transketolase
MVLSSDRKHEIKTVALQVRRDVIKMVNAARCGHPGGPLGMADFLTTLFLSHLNLNKENVASPERDRFILSNGHTCAGYYALLAHLDLIPKDELLRFRKFGSVLQGHPHRNPELGIDFSTGSLGNGISAGVGMALAARVNGWNSRVYVASSDGESQEGQVWEAATAAAHYGVGNLTVIVDFNNIQIDGVMREIMDVRDLRAKYESFGWHAVDIDGHDIEAIDTALSIAKGIADRPSAIIAHTTIGKGVSFMEGQAGWHGVAPNDEQASAALAELV